MENKIENQTFWYKELHKNFFWIAKTITHNVWDIKYASKEKRKNPKLYTIYIREITNNFTKYFQHEEIFD